LICSLASFTSVIAEETSLEIPRDRPGNGPHKMTSGMSVRLFLVDGTPGGLLTAEIVNWTGHVIAAPRSDLISLLGRDETSRTGIYLLIGDDPDSLGGIQVYVGEGDDVRTRLKSHARPEEQGGKDFWDRAIVVTSKDSNLTKAHARYLEARFISLALAAKRSLLTNSTNPPAISLPEADVSDMETFIERTNIVLPVLGVNIFRMHRPPSTIGSLDAKSTHDHSGVDKTSSPVFEFQYLKEQIVACAQEIDGEFTVLAGSQARVGWHALSSNPGYSALKSKLEADGTLLANDEGDKNLFTHDQVFASSSAAAAVIVGRAANGRKLWRIPGIGTSYGEWQSEGVDLVP